MGFSSIGSPLLSSIRRGDYPSFSMESTRPLTHSEIAGLNELSPRALPAVLTQPSGFVVMVSAFPLAATWAGFLVRTTYSIWDGEKLSKNATEYCKLLASQLLAVEKAIGQNFRQRSKRELTLVVSTLQSTTGRGAMLKPDRSYGGFRVGA